MPRRKKYYCQLCGSEVEKDQLPDTEWEKKIKNKKRRIKSGHVERGERREKDRNKNEC
jgi:hypothetical protein